MGNLVLSLFPGIGLLDQAFEEAGFCVVRGPDLLWGGDVKKFHPPAGRFDGVIGGPPCKGDSNLAHVSGTPGKHLRDEYKRVLSEAQPRWWVMEAVKRCDDMQPCEVLKLSPRWLGEVQSRRRFFHSNLDLAKHVDVVLFESSEFAYCVRASNTPGHGQAHYSIPDMLRLQGLPSDFFKDSPLTVRGKEEMIGNGVPLPMGRAIARAVKQALEAKRMFTCPQDDTELQQVGEERGQQKYYCTTCGRTYDPTDYDYEEWEEQFGGKHPSLESE